MSGVDFSAQAAGSLARVAARVPLIHHITNIVVTNDVANITLAFGASPVMAYAPEEVAEMAALAGALALNIGTLSKGEIEAMLLAGRAAASRGVPIVLDPVGAADQELRGRGNAFAVDDAKHAHFGMAREIIEDGHNQRRIARMQHIVQRDDAVRPQDRMREFEIVAQAVGKMFAVDVDESGRTTR